MSGGGVDWTPLERAIERELHDLKVFSWVLAGIGIAGLAALVAAVVFVLP
jgi:hypothetical protein